MNKFFYWLPVLGFMILMLVFMGAFLSGRDPAALPSVLIDKPAPNFALPDLDNKSHAGVDIFKDKITVVNFFASWCAPCRAEVPILNALAAQQGVQILGIAYKDYIDALRSLLSQAGNPFFLVLQDTSGQSSIDWGLTGVPETFIVDAAGRIRYHYAGQLTGQQQDEIVNAIKNIGQK